MKKLLFAFIAAFSLFSANAQINIGSTPSVSYDAPVDYTIADITVTGAGNFDTEAIILFTGLKRGEKVSIPGENISKAIKNLWEQQLFANIKIRVAEVRGSNVYLNIDLEERPRLSRFKFKGVRKSESETLRGKINLRLGTIVNENLLQNTKNIIEKYYVEKGFLQCEVNLNSEVDSIVKDAILLKIDVEKGEKVKIANIFVNGNSALEDKKVKKAMGETKEKRWYKIFTSSKFLENEYEADKRAVIEKYNSKGYRNAKIVSDSVVYNKETNRVNIFVDIKEGQKFHFRNIHWVGNIKYNDAYLSDKLGIKKGDVYNKESLTERIQFSQNNTDISSLYLDDGYLSFSATPVETLVENDSIDFEVRIYEGKQYRVNNIIIKGNTKTNDRIIRRTVRTRPGELFSRADIIRTQRELSQLGYFNPEQFGINPIQNAADGTVDIEYTLEEKPSDQIELSGGFGAGRVVGTLGLKFTNFSLKNIFNGEAYDPLPSGDGQQLSLRAQSNGSYFQAYSFSFVEPWLGGHKPNSFSVSLSHSVQTNGLAKKITVDGESIDNPDRAYLKIYGVSVGLGKRLQVPDDYFSLYQSLSYQHYILSNFGSIFSFADGKSNNVSYTLSFGRNSVSQPIFPRYGSDINLTLKATPPYSLISGKDYSNSTDEEKYKWVEYHKWKVTTSWYTEVAKNLVLYNKAGFGFLGIYNQDIGLSPFERYYLGGSALSGFSLDGREIIGLRGYDDLSLSETTGGQYISKFTTELRYLLSPNPSATIYMLGFFEAGNTWNGFTNYNPYDLKRSGGIGLRIFLPAFGLMGLDYGWRFDDVPGRESMARGQFHFTIGANLGEL
jgi:outer membrane protein insertion porin family